MSQAIQITEPADGSTIKGIVTLKANVTNVSQINWYVDGVLKGKDVTAPFTFDWYTTRYVDGKHVIKAVSGNGKVSDQKTFIIANGVPTVTSNSLNNGDSLKGVVPWTVSVKGNCTKVEFWITVSGTNIKIGEVAGDPGKPYIYNWDTTKFANGSVLMGVVPVDPLGVRFPDENRKTVTISNPVAPVMKVDLAGTPKIGETLTGTISCQ